MKPEWLDGSELRCVIAATDAQNLPVTPGDEAVSVNEVITFFAAFHGPPQLRKEAERNLQWELAEVIALGSVPNAGQNLNWRPFPGENDFSSPSWASTTPGEFYIRLQYVMGGMPQFSNTLRLLVVQVEFCDNRGNSIKKLRLAVSKKSDRHQVIRARTTPAAALSHITFQATSCIAIESEVALDGDSTLSVKATCASERKEDMQVTPILRRGTRLAGLPITASIPKLIALPKPSGKGRVTPINMALDANTSPRAGNVAAGRVILGTSYGFVFKVQILDQFGEALGPLYLDAKVSETIPSQKLYEGYINQVLDSSGCYSDPVGITVYRQYSQEFGGDEFGTLRHDDPLVKDWVSQPPMPMPSQYYDEESVDIFVDGFPISNSGIRKIRGIPPDTVVVEWE